MVLLGGEVKDEVRMLSCSPADAVAVWLAGPVVVELGVSFLQSWLITIARVKAGLNVTGKPCILAVIVVTTGRSRGC